MAPEVISGNGYSYTADYYSLGVFAYELVCGNPPFYRKKAGEDIFDRVKNETPIFPTHVSAEMQDFLKKLLVKDPVLRLGAQGYQQITNHPWLAGINFEKIRARSITAPCDLLSVLADLRYKKIHLMVTQNEEEAARQVTNMDEKEHAFTYDTEERRTLRRRDTVRFSAFSEYKPDFKRSSRSFGILSLTETMISPLFETNTKTIQKRETCSVEKRESQSPGQQVRFLAKNPARREIKRTYDDQEDDDFEVPSESEPRTSDIKSYNLHAKTCLNNVER